MLEEGADRLGSGVFVSVWTGCSGREVEGGEVLGINGDGNEVGRSRR